jgi:hypoxanthine phosphoribosyltransferase
LPVSDEIVRVRREAELVCSEADVAAAFAELGRAVSARVGDRDPVVLAVMQGGAFTAVRLCEHFDFPYELDYVHVSRYGDDIRGGELEWLTRPRLDLTGRTVLVVDDVLDHGITLTELCDALRRHAPRELLVAVLVEKTLAAPRQRPEPDFVGLTVDDVYLFGCGMDYKGYWRGLPALYAVGGP